MKKKMYEQPTAYVVELRVKNQLLVESGFTEDYNWNEEEEV